MITTAILNFFGNFLIGLVGWLPTGGLPGAVATAFYFFTSLLNAFSYFIPVNTLLEACVVVAVFDSAVFVWWFVNWVIRKIPGMQ